MKICFPPYYYPGYPPCGCGSLHNSEDVEGQIVLLERGECSFTSKALKAQEAGAAAAIITEQNPDNDDLYISMVDDDTKRKVKSIKQEQENRYAELLIVLCRTL